MSSHIAQQICIFLTLLRDIFLDDPVLIIQDYLEFPTLINHLISPKMVITCETLINDNRIISNQISKNNMNNIIEWINSMKKVPPSFNDLLKFDREKKTNKLYFAKLLKIATKSIKQKKELVSQFNGIVKENNFLPLIKLCDDQNKFAWQLNKEEQKGSKDGHVFEQQVKQRIQCYHHDWTVLCGCYAIQFVTGTKGQKGKKEIKEGIKEIKEEIDILCFDPTTNKIMLVGEAKQTFKLSAVGQLSSKLDVLKNAELIRDADGNDYRLTIDDPVIPMIYYGGTVKTDFAIYKIPPCLRMQLLECLYNGGNVIYRIPEKLNGRNLYPFLKDNQEYSPSDLIYRCIHAYDDALENAIHVPSINVSGGPSTDVHGPPLNRRHKLIIAIMKHDIVSTGIAIAIPSTDVSVVPPSDVSIVPPHNVSEVPSTDVPEVPSTDVSEVTSTDVPEVTSTDNFQAKSIAIAIPNTFNND